MLDKDPPKLFIVADPTRALNTIQDGLGGINIVSLANEPDGELQLLPVGPRAALLLQETVGHFLLVGFGFVARTDLPRSELHGLTKPFHVFLDGWPECMID